MDYKIKQYDLIKRLYLLMKNNGYNDEYFDDLLFNKVYNLNYLANNKIIVNDVEVNENELLDNISDAKRLIINNERTIENINISYITTLVGLDYCECISNNLILSNNITIPLNLKTLIIPEPINNISINCDSNLKFCSFVNNKTDLINAFNNLTFNNEPIKYYGLSDNTEDLIYLNDLTYENMYIDLKNFMFYSSNSGNTNIKNIILSDSGKIISLGNSCFRNCSNLSSIDIPTSISNLGNYCFSNWSNLSSINVPTSVTNLGNYCFGYCSNLSSIDIPTSVSSIGEYCFNFCTSLSSINIPTSVSNLKDYCFSNCSSLSSINIPTSVSNLGESCFNGCSSLLSIDIPTSVTSLGEICFHFCTSLSSINIPTSITSLRNSCFNSCYSLSSINIPTSITSLETGCFHKCTSLSSIIIPTSVSSIGKYCFQNTKSDIEFKILATIQSEANPLGLKIKNTSNAPSTATYYYFNSNNNDWSPFTPTE